jgi:hypothetical protein
MTILSKSAFARAVNVTPGRVTQWLRAKQVSGRAVIGEGRSAKINLELAREQLKLRLDTDQRYINGLDTRLDDPAPAKAPEAVLIDEIGEYFEGEIPRLAEGLAAARGVSLQVAYFIGEEWFEAIEGVRGALLAESKNL